jgi:hypothetical protein
MTGRGYVGHIIDNRAGSRGDPHKKAILKIFGMAVTKMSADYFFGYPG